MAGFLGRKARLIGVGAVIVFAAALAVGSLSAGSADRSSAGQASDGMGLPSAEEGGDAFGGTTGYGGPAGAPALDSDVAARSVETYPQADEAPPTPGGLSSFGDRIVRTADISVEIDEGRFEPAWTQVGTIARRFGGRILASSRHTDGRPEPLGREARDEQPLAGDIMISVPTENFEEAADALRAIGIVRAESIGSEDVTQEYVDLQSRVRNLRSEQRVLLALMARARSVRDTLQVQSRLSEVQGELEQLQGRINWLDARTEFSTLNVHLAEPGVITSFAEIDEGPSFAKAWDTALVGLERMGTAAMIAVLWALPFALLALIAMWIARARRPAPQA